MYFDAPVMTKGREKFYCEVNIDESYENRIADEWCSAYVFNRRGQGAEYRYRYDGKNDRSAIYKLDEYGHTHVAVADDYEFYEIDFSDDHWREKLTDAMIECVKKWWKEDY